MLFYILIFLFGLAVGSFLNVVIYRLEKGERIINDRSRCPHCQTTLAWYDLVPILSFLLLAGKCRYCKKAISLQYPLVELTTGILFVLIIWTFQDHSGQVLDFEFVSSFPEGQQVAYGAGKFQVSSLLNVFYLWFIVSSLIIIFVYDIKHYIIPDKIVYPAILVSGIWYLVSGIFLNLHTKYYILNTIFAALIAAGFFLSIVILSQGQGMGMGDVKLAFLMGLVLGWPNILLALFVAFTIGAIFGIILIALKKKTLKSVVPFGPFLVIGTFIAIFWGKEIIDWYFKMIIG